MPGQSKSPSTGDGARDFSQSSQNASHILVFETRFLYPGLLKLMGFERCCIAVPTKSTRNGKRRDIQGVTSPDRLCEVSKDSPYILDKLHCCFHATRWQNVQGLRGKMPLREPLPDLERRTMSNRGVPGKTRMSRSTFLSNSFKKSSILSRGTSQVSPVMRLRIVHVLSPWKTTPTA